jgi:mannose-6-phosphate isomerase-like protein (cupin superfamily)
MSEPGIASDHDVASAKLNRDSDERFQRLRSELDVSSFGLNLIVLAGGQRGRIHNHERQEEVFLVLEGELTLSVEGVDRVFGVDQVVRIGPAVRRQLINASPERLILLAIGGSGEHAGHDGHAWASWDEPGPGRAPQEVPPPADLRV